MSPSEAGKSAAALPEVSIQTMSASTLTLLLEFLYCARIVSPLPDPTALFDLLVAANMLALPRLVNICERELSPLLDVDNVLELYAAASTHEATQLKQMCLHVMGEHYEELSKKSSFKEALDQATREQLRSEHEQFLREKKAYEEWCADPRRLISMLYDGPVDMSDQRGAFWSS